MTSLGPKSVTNGRNVIASAMACGSNSIKASLLICAQVLH